jgi:peptide subunit release factor RF-3
VLENDTFRRKRCAIPTRIHAYKRTLNTNTNTNLKTHTNTRPACLKKPSGELQFEVVLDRLEGEYGVKAAIERVSFTIARWARPELAREDAWVTSPPRAQNFLPSFLFF